MKKFLILVLTSITIFLNIPKTSISQQAARIAVSQEKLLKKPTFKTAFVQTYKDPEMINLHLPGEVGKYGADNVCAKIIRVWRFKNITDASEQRYNLPKLILLAMAMEESTGLDLFGNAGDDGGFGLIHMQPLLATNFGLMTFNKCDKLVCKPDAKELRKKIKEANYDRKKVVGLDDRLNPVLNIDCAARMLAYYLQMKPIPGLGPMRSAIYRYAGSGHYQEYWNDIVNNMAYLSNPTVLAQVEFCFNTLNKGLIINGKPADFDTYIRISREQNYNYGLGSYKKLTPYAIKNSDRGATMYHGFINKLKAKTGCGCVQ